MSSREESRPDSSFRRGRSLIFPAGGSPGSGVPAVRERLVLRTALIDRLLRDSEPVISVVAPPGYGKTTLLVQLAHQLRPRVAWVSCEQVHNDPAALWGDILAALNRIEPVSEQAMGILATSGGGAEAVPQLVVAISALQGPVLVVLDHLETVTSPQCTTSIAELALRVPAGWQLALASRDALPIPMSRLRMDGRMVEISVDELAMAEQEGAALLRQAGANVSAAEGDELVKLTEGWPAGLYLAALAIQSGSPATGFSFSGDDRLVEDYLRSELLARLSRSQASFLVRTSILDRMSGPLCDAMTGGNRSARMLEELERHNLLVVPLDRRGEWYRYHHLLRQMLQADLRRSDPELVRELHSRAADWYEANGMAETAVQHADSAGDTERLARLVLELMQPVWLSGRVETVRAWMDLLDTKPRVPVSAAVAAHGALIFALLGRTGEAERWVGVAENLPATGTLPDGTTIAATIAYLRAILSRDGPAAMRADAAVALEGLSPASPYRATMLHYDALSWILDGDLDRADNLFTRAYDAAVAFGAAPLAALTLTEQSLIAAERGQWLSVESMLGRAVEIVDSGHLDGYWSSALIFAAAARAAAHRGEMRQARQLVQRAARLRPLLTYALPVVSLQTLIELARTYLALVDPSGALAVLEQAQDIIRRRPDLGTLPVTVERLQARVDQITVAAAIGASSLTTAELRLMPLLPTHLSLPQIAERLYVSPHTVKAQVKSIYRKLGVSSRGAAVDLMADLSVPL